MTFNNVLLCLYEADIFDKQITFQRVYLYFKINKLMFCDILREEFEKMIFSIAGNSDEVYEGLIDKFARCYSIHKLEKSVAVLLNQKSGVESTYQVEDNILMHFFEPGVQGVYFELSEDLQRVFTLYCEDNYRTNEVLLNWQDLIITGYKIPMNMIETLLTDLGVVPNYLTISKVNKLLVEFERLEASFMPGKSNEIVTIEDMDTIGERDHIRFDFHDFLLLLSFIGVKILARGNLDMYNLEDIVRLFLSDYVHLKENGKRDVGGNAELSNAFVKRYAKHRDHLLEREAIDSKLEEEYLKNGLDNFCVDFDINIKSESRKTIMEQLMQHLKFYKADRRKEKKQTKIMSTFTLPQLSKGRGGHTKTKTTAQKLGNAQAPGRAKVEAKDEKVTFSNLDLYKKLRASQNLNDTKLPEDKKITELELIYEVPVYHRLTDNLKADLDLILNHFINKDHLLCDKLIHQMLAALNACKEVDYELITYLYYLEGLVYMDAERTDYALHFFFKGMKNEAK